MELRRLYLRANYACEAMLETANWDREWFRTLAVLQAWERGIGLGWSFIMLSFRKYKQSSEDIPCRFSSLTILAKSVPRRSMKPHNN